jgi:hypothetical protein
MQKITLHYATGDKEYKVGDLLDSNHELISFKYNYNTEMVEFNTKKLSDDTIHINYLIVKYVPFSIIG